MSTEVPWWKAQGHQESGVERRAGLAHTRVAIQTGIWEHRYSLRPTSACSNLRKKEVTVRIIVTCTVLSLEISYVTLPFPFNPVLLWVNRIKVLQLQYTSHSPLETKMTWFSRRTQVNSCTTLSTPKQEKKSRNEYWNGNNVSGQMQEKIYSLHSIHCTE